MSSTDRIEKEIVLNATQPRVWRALTDSTEFGQWFGLRIDGPFEAGKPVTGQLTNPGYEHVSLKVMVQSIEPERLFSYRWHPFAMDPKVDYSAEPTTLVEFRLAEAPGGVTLTIVESGFDALPASRREEAFRMNDKGWGSQLERIRKYVAG